MGISSSKKAENAHGDAQREIQGTAAPDTGPESPEANANPAVNGDFGKEDHEYISGYRLYAALFGIMSVFFLVLLDFSITATAIPYITISTSSMFFILGRIIAGLGSSALENGALNLVAEAVPMHKRPCFYINLPIGVVSSLFLFFTRVPEETLKPPFSLALVRRIIPELELTGFALFAPTTVIFLIALHWGSTEHGWSSPVVIGLFAASGATLLMFSLWEWHVGEKSLIPFHLIKRRRVRASAMQSTTLFCLNYVGVNYVPIYFQAVKGVGPWLSGVYMLPSILTQLLSLVISGALAWIGHQILFGLRGLGLQMSVISVQNAVTPAQSPSAIAFLLFVENLASAIFTVVGNVIFTQTLTRQVSILAPSVSPEAALAVGGSAEAVRGLLPPGSPELHGLLLAFSDSINAVFYLLVALGAVSFAASWGMGWVNVRKKATEQNGTEGVVEGARGSDGVERGPASKRA
ncbi:hypothetical protein COL922a_008775 [Colletotrichum nupharicola]|nr:hypothetical protein COL922a_008775 [Colletotrichum nupharicola]